MKILGEETTFFFVAPELILIFFIQTISNWRHSCSEQPGQNKRKSVSLLTANTANYRAVPAASNQLVIGLQHYILDILLRASVARWKPSIYMCHSTTVIAVVNCNLLQLCVPALARRTASWFLKFSQKQHSWLLVAAVW